MAPKSKTLNDYERQRLENIRRNGEMMASLLLHRKASDLSSTLKRHRSPSSAPPKPSSKKPKPAPKSRSETETPTPIVIRRSLRTRGVPPQPPSSGFSTALPTPPPSSPPSKRGPLLIHEAFFSGPNDSGSGLIAAILSASSRSEFGLVKEEGFDPKLEPDLVKEEDRDRKLDPGTVKKEDFDLISELRLMKEEGFFPKSETDLGKSEGLYPTSESALVKKEGFEPKPEIDLVKKEGFDPTLESVLVNKENSDPAPYLGPVKEEVFCSMSGSGPVNEEVFNPRLELALRPENAAKVVSDRILSARFLSLVDRVIIAVGNKIGNLGFWDVNCPEGDEDGIYLYQPHSSPVSGISVHPFTPRKIFTSSYDGFIRLMDIEKETFNMVLSSENCIFSISQCPRAANSLYVGEGGGLVKAWDERVGKASSFWELHSDRINTIDFSSENVNLMVTSSTDGCACIWDLRRMKKDVTGWESLKRISHDRAVHSAYFSPSGKFLATTSLDDRVGIVSGANFDDISMVSHNNCTGRWLSSFRAIWGWDDSYLFLGNMKRAIDVISTSDKTTTSLDSPDMTSIPCRFAAHPYMLGHLAGTTSGGKVFLWTKE